jgi:sarcosine oxidase
VSGTRTVTVAGAGVFGVAAALELRARGHEVVLVDPGPLPRPEAASTDISKVVRMDYGKDVLYTELMETAFPRWRAWNARWGGPLYHETGFLLLSRTSIDAGGFEGDSLATLTARGHRVERLDAMAIAKRFPAWSEGGYVDGYFNPAAGWAASSAVIARMIDEARAAGVAVRTGEGLALDRRGPIVVAAGAWTPAIVPGLEDLMWPVAQPVFHLKPSDPKPFHADRFPVWAADIARTGWYGFPAGDDGIVKIANHGPGRRVDPDSPRTTTADDEDRLRAFLREALPALVDAPIAASKTCLYCDSFDGHLWIGRDPARPDLVVASGGSGHGFKFAPVLGGLIADAVLGVPNRFAPRFAWRDRTGRSTEAARFGQS